MSSHPQNKNTVFWSPIIGVPLGCFTCLFNGTCTVCVRTLSAAIESIDWRERAPKIRTSISRFMSPYRLWFVVFLFRSYEVPSSTLDLVRLPSIHPQLNRSRNNSQYHIRCSIPVKEDTWTRTKTMADSCILNSAILNQMLLRHNWVSMNFFKFFSLKSTALRNSAEVS